MICPSNGIRSRLVFACAVALALTLAGGAAANPRDIPAGARLVYSFEVLGYPAGQAYNGGCGNGHRIFVNREANKAQILVTNGNFWTILDCNATSDHQARLQSSQLGIFDVYTRILGKPGGHIHVCGDLTIDPVTGDTLCLAGTLDLTRASGQSKFQLAPSSLFDASLEDVLWTVDTNTNFRNAQFRVYKRP
jgi:hypothetical protein